MTAREQLIAIYGSASCDCEPTLEQLLDAYRDEIRAEQLHDPRNQVAVSMALRREARIDPSWLANFIASWERRSGRGYFLT